MIVPVILAGGSGTRLWPFSREALPKQFISLLGDKTLLQHSIQRIVDLPKSLAPIFLASEKHRFILQEQIKEMGILNPSIILEPFGRNTAPAMTVAALFALQQWDDPLLLVLPSDHIVLDKSSFHKTVENAEKLVQDNFVTFGVSPTRAETGYGYIHYNNSKVLEFIEKPNLEKAKGYIASGNYYWNSGIFFLRASQFLKKLEIFAPDILLFSRRAFLNARKENNFILLDKTSFAACPNESVDYAVMEKTQDLKVVPLSSGWSDVGSWNSLWEVNEKDSEGNVSMGDVFLQDVKNSYIHAGNRMVVALGIEDHIIVESKDAILISHKNASQQVKHIVEKLNLIQRNEVIDHTKKIRPWGWFETLEKRENFQVKRIVIKNGASLSLQLHQHRSEHWVVVSGMAKVIRGEESFHLTKNQSMFIPMNTKHRLSNIGHDLLEVIEIQIGDYLEEDDIVRFEDNYGRALAINFDSKEKMKET